MRPLLTAVLRALFPGVHPGSGVAVAGVAVVALGIGWGSPMSPVALGRADARLASGDADGAIAAYDAVSRWNPVPSIRRDAALRGGMVALVEQGRPADARRRFLAVVADGSGPQVAFAREQLGHLDRERDPGAAGASFFAAWEADPRAPEAADRLKRAAEAWRDSGDRKAAFSAWDRLARLDPDRRAAAWLAEADWLLADGGTEQALVLYEKAAGVGDVAEVQAAHLGAATCHERLGDLDEALTALDEADLPDGIGDARAANLRARADGEGVRPAYKAPPAAPPRRRR